ncbi:tripartite motif-containing protein 75-like [Suncus etruscus]|uniref:tripartite motif-containing protein 75-like n=1 Tax=Suncus etruscus TaxID=109475 RepID=UPI00210F28DA|nr:tripartite motif-containing protein 75-like [Suncus etruscus]
MALAASLAELRTEACCPLCHDFLQEPVTLECGHNCCGSCLQQRWEHLHDVLPCPVCLHPCTDGHPQKNTQLGDLIDLVQQILCMRETNSDDLELLCGQCGESPEHQAHDLMPIVEAAAHHRQKLKSCLGQLGEQLEEAVRALERNDAEFTELKGQLKLQKQNVTQEGSQLAQFLRKQDYSMGKKLVHQKAGIYRHDAAALHLAWRQHQSLGFPEAPSLEHKGESLSLPPSYIGLDNMRAKFQVHLMLDPETAHSDLLISHQTTASYCQEGAQPSPGMRPSAFTSRVAVLGAPGFGGGRHFWQVEIRGLGVWCLGVCTEAFSRDTWAAQTPAMAAGRCVVYGEKKVGRKIPSNQTSDKTFILFPALSIVVTGILLIKHTETIYAFEPLPMMNIISCDECQKVGLVVRGGIALATQQFQVILAEQAQNMCNAGSTLQNILPCPMCLHPCTDGHPQKNNTQLGHMG